MLHENLTGCSAEEIVALPDEVLNQVGATLVTLNAIAIADSMGRSCSSAVLAAKPYLDYVENQRG